MGKSAIVSSYRNLGDFYALSVEANGRLWVNQRDKLLFSDNNGDTFQYRASYDPGIVKKCGGKSRLFYRLLRLGFRNLTILSCGTLIASLRGAILRCGPDQETFSKVMEINNKSFLIEQTPNDLLFAGEYFYNTTKEPVHIYISEDKGQSWRIKYTFPGNIRHIHNIIYDEIRDCLLVLTGDLDSESKVLVSYDTMESLHPIIEGNQSARAVSAIPTEKGFYLATDTQYEQNYVQFLKENGEIEQLLPISGSCLAMNKVDNCFFFGTAAEPSNVNLDPCPRLYATSDGLHWEVIRSWKADRWSKGSIYKAMLFQMGRITMPCNKCNRKFLYVNTLAVEKNDGMLHRWNVNSP